MESKMGVSGLNFQKRNWLEKKVRNKNKVFLNEQNICFIFQMTGCNIHLTGRRIHQLKYYMIKTKILILKYLLNDWTILSLVFFCFIYSYVTLHIIEATVTWYVTRYTLYSKMLCTQRRSNPTQYSRFVRLVC